MKVALIVAMSANGVIGHNNQLPWRLPEDLKHFKGITMGKPMVMGRKTFDSIGRPLPGRTSIVVTRQPGWRHEGVLVASSLEAALALAEQYSKGNDEVMVIGGAEIYEQALPLASRLYLTRVETTVAGDTYFPEPDPERWILSDSTAGFSEQTGLHFRFEILDRPQSA